MRADLLWSKTLRPKSYRSSTFPRPGRRISPCPRRWTRKFSWTRWRWKGWTRWNCDVIASTSGANTLHVSHTRVLLPYFSIIALRPHVPRLEFGENAISVDDAYISRLTVPLLDHWLSMLRVFQPICWHSRSEHPSSSPLPLIRRGLRKIWNKVTAIELLRLQKRNIRSCRDTLRPRTCQCRTQVHTSSAKILKFLFYLTWWCMVKSTTSTFKTEMMPTEG